MGPEAKKKRAPLRRVPGLGLRKALRNGPTPKQYTRAAAPDICPGVYQVTCPGRHARSACLNLKSSFKLTVWAIAAGEKTERVQGLHAHEETHEVVGSRTRAGIVVETRTLVSPCSRPWRRRRPCLTRYRACVYIFPPALSAIEKMVSKSSRCDGVKRTLRRSITTAAVCMARSSS